MEQTVFLEKTIVFLAYLVTILGTIYTITRQRKKDREKALAEFAKKDEVNKDFKAMEKRIESVEKVSEQNRKENLEAHDKIKKEITDHFDKRFDDFKGYMRDLIKSA